MIKKDCTFERTLDELLTWPLDLLVLVGHDGDDDSDADADDDDNDGDDNDDDNDADADGDDDDDSDDEDESVDALKKSISDRDEQINNLKAKRKRQEARISTLIKERDDALAAKGDGADEATKQQVSQLSDENGKLKGSVKDLSLQNAFLRANTHDWVDPDTALKLADLSDVEVDEETGEVDKADLKAALDKLAKSKKYLLKESSGKPAPKSGSKPDNRRQTADSKKKREADLKRRYPALRNR